MPEVEGRLIREVGFQQAPRFPVDDLVLRAGPYWSEDIDLLVPIAVRRAPRFTAGDQGSQQLVLSLVSALADTASYAERIALAVAVGGRQTQAEEVANLTSYARRQPDPKAFFHLFETPGRQSRQLHNRLHHLVDLTRRVLSDEEDGEDVVWQLLSNLHVLTPRLEPPHEDDWMELANLLDPFSVGGGVALRDRLMDLVSTYASTAARVSQDMLYRDTADALPTRRPLGFPRKRNAREVGGGVSVSMVVVGTIPMKPACFVESPVVDLIIAEATEALYGPTVWALSGLRGAGKTQMAASICRRCAAAGFSLVAWVNAETEEELLAGVSAVADRLGISDPKGDSHKSAQNVRDFLTASKTRSVLVFDNATRADLVLSVTPVSGPSLVLITTNHVHFHDCARSVEVSGFTPEEAVAYLEGRTGLCDETAAGQVARELACLPLALAQASGMMMRRNLTYRDYTAMLESMPVEQILPISPSDTYERSTAAALLLSLDSAVLLGSEHGVELLLRVVAVLSPAGVSREVISEAALASQHHWNVDGALEVAESLALVHWHEASRVVQMHRLVARVLRERDEERGVLRETVGVAADLLEVHLFDQSHAWQKRHDGSSLISHIEAVWSCCDSSVSDTSFLARILGMRGWGLRQLAAAWDLQVAADYGNGVWDDAKRVLGPSHPTTLSVGLSLARVWHGLGGYARAIQMFEALIPELASKVGTDHQEVLDARHNLAWSYRGAGDIDAALSGYQSLLADKTRVLGYDHPSTLQTRNNHAWAIRAKGNAEEAVALFRGLLEAKQRVLGPQALSTLITMDNLAGALRASGRYDESIALFDCVLSEKAKELGSDHPSTLATKNNRAYAHAQAGGIADAEAMYLEVLNDRMRVLGNEHPATLDTGCYLAGLLVGEGRYVEAIDVYDVVVRGRERVLGEDHVATIAAREALSAALLRRDAG